MGYGVESGRRKERALHGARNEGARTLAQDTYVAVGCTETRYNISGHSVH